MSSGTFQWVTRRTVVLFGRLACEVMAALLALCLSAGLVLAQDTPQNPFDAKGPQFNWVLNDNPAGLCARASKDGTHTEADACSYWVQQERRCTLVTKPDKASHHVLGVLFSACQRGLRA
ncbi:hypothetical protein [Limnohabitans sp. DM1]|uniref:hypothetical protein n=1 Tax=Limnohabitans sp. DM1 TaxID=1597955 RepID=UPI000AF89BD9|nr:hypothetical protein [Limnohabitans sp. DM1]